MKEELYGQLSEILGEARDLTPEMVRQVLAAGTALNWVSVIIGVLLILFGSFTWYKYWVDDWDSGDIGAWICWFFGAIFLFVGIAFLIIIKYAPLYYAFQALT